MWKDQQTDFDAIYIEPKRRRALDLQSRENRQKLLQGAKWRTFANAGIFQVPTVDSDEMACEKTNRPTLMRFAPNQSAEEPSTCNRGKTAKRCSREQNEALLLMLIFSRIQQWIQMEWPVKAPTERLWGDSYQTQGQESPWLAVLGQRQKLLQGASWGTFANVGIFQVPSVDPGGMACERTNRPTLMQFAPNPRSGVPSTCSFGITPKVAPWPKTRHFC